MNIFSEKQLSSLREEISKQLSPKRMAHVLAVEDMAQRIGRLFDCELSLLRAAALLHDCTKELSDAEQLALLSSYSVIPLPEELASMPTIHALTASLVIPDRYPEFDNKRVINAVRYHTTGREGMSLEEKIIFLSDFIDETRKYLFCVELRNEFFSAEPEMMAEKERQAHLDRAVLRSIESTLSHLRAKGSSIHPATLATQADLIGRLKNEA